MAKDFQEMPEKVERLGSLLFTGKRQQGFWFWFVGLGIIIPTVTYISTTLLAFLLGVVLNQIGILSELYVKPMISAILVVCAAFSLFGYYRLWIMCKQKKGTNFTPHNHSVHRIADADK